MNPPNTVVSVGNAKFSNKGPLTLIAGPCQLESRDHAFDMAGALKELCEKLGIGLVYKTSYDKANRTSLSSTRGAGLDAALPVFDDLRKTFGLPVLTDIHIGRAVRHRRAACRRAADPGLPVAPDRSAGRCGKDRQGDQRQEGPVPGALGHEERRRQDHRFGQCQCAGHRARRVVRLQYAGVRHARAADHGRHRRAGDIRRHAFGAAAGRAGHYVRAASGASSRHWRAPPLRSASRAYSSKRIRTPTTRPRRTAPT